MPNSLSSLARITLHVDSCRSEYRNNSSSEGYGTNSMRTNGTSRSDAYTVGNTQRSSGGIDSYQSISATNLARLSDDLVSRFENSSISMRLKCRVTMNFLRAV